MSKASKIMAHYQPYPNDLESCKKCTMFVAPHDCTAVQGRVFSAAWCKYFELVKGPFAKLKEEKV